MQQGIGIEQQELQPTLVRKEDQGEKLSVAEVRWSLVSERDMGLQID
jgi:hypothetical protein